MAFIYNFEEAKKAKEFNIRLMQKNDDFLKVYERIMEIEYPLSKKWFTGINHQYALYGQTSKSVFGTEENMRAFYETVMWSLGIRELPTTELTFTAFKEYGDVTQKLARIMFHQEVGHKYVDLYDVTLAETDNQMNN